MVTHAQDTKATIRGLQKERSAQEAELTEMRHTIDTLKELLQEETSGLVCGVDG